MWNHNVSWETELELKTTTKHHPSSVCPSSLHLSALLPVPVQLHQGLCWEQLTGTRQKSSKASFSCRVTRAQHTLNMPLYVKFIVVLAPSSGKLLCCIWKTSALKMQKTCTKITGALLPWYFISGITDSLTRPRQQMLKYLKRCPALCVQLFQVL